MSEPHAPRATALRSIAALVVLATLILFIRCSRDPEPAESDRFAAAATIDDPWPIEVSDGEPTEATWLPDRNGLWCAAIVYDGQSDRIALTRSGDDRERILARGGRYLDIASSWREGGEAVFVWSEHGEHGWQLHLRTLTSGRLSEDVALTGGPGEHRAPALARGPSGELWVTWSAKVGGRWSVELARIDGTALEDRRVLSTGRLSLAPAIAVLASGAPIVAWDGFLKTEADLPRDFEVLIWAPDGEGRPATFRLSDHVGLDARPSIAADAYGGAWIGWHSDDGDWGRSRALNQQRRLELVYFRDGRVGRPAGVLPRVLPEPLDRLASNPKLAVDSVGGVQLLFTGLTIPQQVQPREFQGLGANFKAAVWELFRLRFSAQGWSSLERLARSDGGARPRVALATGPNGDVWAGWIGDGRRAALESGRDFETRRPESSRSAISAAPLASGERGLPEVPSAGLDQAMRLSSEPSEEDRACPSWHVDGREYRLAFGDFHRHTDISRCASRTDGTLEEAYRYALGPGELDVLCTTDHVTDTRETTWWEIQKLADVYDDPGRFVALYGYERAEGALGGHKNLFFKERAGPQVLPEDAKQPQDLWRMLRETDVFGIPHMLASRGNPTDWSRHDPVFEPVAEIYQGVRGAYEMPGGPLVAGDAVEAGAFAIDALRAGRRFGFIAASDHDSVAESYAGLWVQELSRDGVFEAMRARRTFAATARVVLRFTVDGVPCGGVVAPRSVPTLEAVVEGAGTGRLEILADGEVIHTAQLTGEGTVKLVDDAFQKRRFYYARLVTDTAVAWSSPVFRD
ncbi:MAG: DUF3604 domain-containing protein [Planctomycetota bacterium]